jgi:small subunit ribosomal protein S21
LKPFNMEETAPQGDFCGRFVGTAGCRSCSNVSLSEELRTYREWTRPAFKCDPFYNEFKSASIEEVCVVKLRVREKESIQEAVRRFRKLVEHSGVKKEMRRREYYEKPSDMNRRARRRAERRARMARLAPP